MRDAERLCVLALSAVLVSGCASRTGGIRGPVADETGQAVTAAHVTVTRVGSGEKWEATVNGRGWYFVDALQPGRYEVRAEAPEHAAATPEAVRMPARSGPATVSRRSTRSFRRGRTSTWAMWIHSSVSRLPEHPRRR
jgi:hypothetical protein